MKSNFKKFLPILGGVLTLAGWVVNNIIDANEYEEMKTELKEELMQELKSNK